MSSRLTRRRFLAGSLSLLALADRFAAAGAEPPQQPWWPVAPPLSQPTGEVIRVSTVDELFAAAEKVRPGGTILLADGHYRMPRYFELHTDNATLRSQSGRRERVILDGAESRHGELVGISRCSGVTIADLTVQNVRFNGLKINSNLGATRVTIRNCVIHNVWQRGVKGPGVPKESRDTLRPTDCRIEYCLFYNDRTKQFADDPTDRPDTFGGNYVGGIDVMYAKGWTISDNVFLGIHGRTGGARGAIFLWHDAQDCTIERNVILDCDTGICLGNSHRGPETTIHCTGCLVRNNLVVRCPESGILADYTRDCRILHNTIHDPGSRLQRLIRLVHDNDGLVVAHNLLSGPPMRIETRSEIKAEGNLVKSDAGDWFLDPAGGNLHLRPDFRHAVGTVPRLPEVQEDFDRHRRAQRTAVGADEPDADG